MTKRVVFTNEEAAFRLQDKVGGEIYSAYNWAEQETNYIVVYKEEEKLDENKYLKEN